MGWYLEDIETEEKVFSYSHFRRERIKKDLVKYFTENPKAELWFYKEDFESRTVGDDLISVFLLIDGKLCKEIYRGNKTCLLYTSDAADD